MFKKSCLFIIALLAAGVFSVSAQDSTQIVEVDEAITQLTKGSSKQWVYQGTETVTQGKGKCRQEEKWTFSKTGTVTGTVSIEKCVNGKWSSESPKNWSLAKTSRLELTLTIGDKSFILQLYQDKPKKMTLRKKQPGQTQPTDDLLFLYEGS